MCGQHNRAEGQEGNVGVLHQLSSGLVHFPVREEGTSTRHRPRSRVGIRPPRHTTTLHTPMAAD